MKYMLMLFDDEEWWNTVTEEQMAEEMKRHEAFATWCAGQGVAITGGEALQTSATATTLRPGSDEMLITDGPYAELKEHLGGFYIIEARDLDQAMEAARRCPMGSGTEVRPVWDISS
jgi:hypothetical protein